MGKPITFIGIKLKVLDEQRRDRAISDLDFRVLHAILSATDRHTGLAIRKRETLARDAGCKSVRAIEKSVARWIQRGVIAVNRGGGRGRANEYRLAKQTTNSGTPVSSSAQAETANHGAPFAAAERANSGTQNGERQDEERANRGSPPPLYRSQNSSLAGDGIPRANQVPHAQVAPSGLSYGSERQGWRCWPFSPEFHAWVAFYTDKGWTRAKQEMLISAHAGK